MENRPLSEVMLQRALSHRGMSRLEVLVIVLTASLLLLILLPLVQRSRVKSSRGSCLVRLRWLGTDISVYAHDHAGKLPWQVPPPEGAATASSSVVHYWRPLYGAADSALDLVCPQDERQPARSVSELSDSNISYFANLSARWGDGKAVVAGDRYLTTNRAMLHGLFDLTTNSKVRWTERSHNYAGHLLFLDGSAIRTTTNLVPNFFMGTNRLENHLVIP